MVKKENESFSMPSDSSVPPGFPPKSSTTKAVVPTPAPEDKLMNQNPPSFWRHVAKRKRMQISQISCQEIEIGNNTKVSPAPQSSSQTNNQLCGESSKCNVSPSDKNRAISTPKSTFHTHNIEETTIVAPVSEVPIQNSSFYPKILQNVEHALKYTAESQPSATGEIDRSRSSDMRTDLVLTAKGIYLKHGEITKNCSLESDCMRTFVWIGISKVVQDLKNKKLSEIDTSSLDSYYTIIKDAKKINVNVKWLHSQLDEIKEAVKWAEEEKHLMEEKDRRVQSIDKKKHELVGRKMDLERLKSEIQEKEDQLAREIATVQELNTKIVIQTSRFSQLQHTSLMDGLV